MKRFLLIMASFIMVMTTISAGIGEQEETDDMARTFTNETLHDCIPYTFNTEKAETLGLARDAAFTDEYFKLQAFYCEALWNWLCIKADLVAVDTEIGKNELNFIVRTLYPTVYQEKQSFGTQYLYIRSNIMIENLSRDDLDMLRALYEKGTAGSEEVYQFIGDTWLKVITQNTDFPADAMTILDLSNRRRVANCSLLLGIDTMYEIDNEGRIVNDEHESEKASFLNRLATALGEELTDVFGIPVEVIVHD